MNFIYPDRPKKEMWDEMKKKFERQLDRLGVDFDELNDEEKKRAKVRSKIVSPELQDFPTLATYLTLFALAWRYREAREDRSIFPWMNAMAVQSLGLDLTDSDVRFPITPEEETKVSRTHPLHDRTIYRCLEAFEKEKIVKAEKVGKNRFVYSIAVPRGFHVLNAWEEEASRSVWYDDGTEGPKGSRVYGFLGAINAVFNLMVKRFLHFQTREDFESLRRYVGFSLKNLKEVYRPFQEYSETNLPIEDLWGDIEVAFTPVDYFSQEPSQVLNSFEELKGENGKAFLQEPEAYINHWRDCAKTESRKQFALVCASSIFLETVFYENQKFVAALNMCLFWAEVVAAIKKRFQGQTE